MVYLWVVIFRDPIMIKWFVFASSIILSACDSPRNHRVNPSELLMNSQNIDPQFKTLPLKMKLQWVAGPYGTVEQKSKLLVTFLDTNDRLTSLPNEQELSFYATMPSMGHPLSHPGYFKKISEGIYLNEDIIFNMGGDWLMELSILNNSGEIKDEIKWSFFF